MKYLLDINERRKINYIEKIIKIKVVLGKIIKIKVVLWGLALGNGPILVFTRDCQWIMFWKDEKCPGIWIDQIVHISVSPLAITVGLRWVMSFFYYII